MGLFDRSKKKHEERPVETGFKTLPNGEMISLLGLMKINQFRHRDGRVTDAYIARITRQPEDHVMIYDNMDYISFEVPTGMQIMKRHMDSILNAYEFQKNPDRHQKDLFYLGRMQDNGENIQFGEPSATVKNYMQNVMNQTEKRRAQEVQEKLARQREEEKRRQEEFMKRDAEMRRQNDIFERARKAERLANPEIDCINRMKVGSKVYSDYDATDLLTGEYLRLRETDKVCKNQDGTYLYATYINRTHNEDDVELLGRDGPQGQYVCFTLPGRLEDIVKAGNPDQIKQLLTLLSDRRSTEFHRGISFIGGIDKQGRVNFGGIPPKEFTDPIRVLDKNYKIRKGIDQQNRDDSGR